MNQPDMRQIAKRAGVSLATVSYVVNDGPRPVSQELRARVLAAMADLGYARSPRGRRRSRPLVIGLVVPDANNQFFGRTVASIEHRLRSSGHLLITASSHGDPVRERELLAAFARHGVDGLIASPVAEVPPELEAFGRQRPAVLIDWDGGETSLNRVVMDNHRIAFLGTRLLIESGHRRIVLINGPKTSSAGPLRLRGYRDALADAGLAAFESVREGPFTAAAGRALALAVLGETPRPDAILAGSVLITFGALQALRELRLRIPDDVAIIGFGDQTWASIVVPPLTVIEQPIDELGERAVDLLLAPASMRTAGQRIELESKLVVRESHRKVESQRALGL